eukprot:TRINITY_DN2036_c0_g1_i1.p1 TRINITY_DN2036_c0_g1~~TRINITY_DN2036_c0_g1_i1.p1  ORF type:complete len:760 (+),score=145.17 TRINITY_DN2036_c0_g1_i1:146-2425(+)
MGASCSVSSEAIHVPPAVSACCSVQQLPTPKVAVAAAPAATIRPRLQAVAEYGERYEEVGERRLADASPAPTPSSARAKAKAKANSKPIRFFYVRSKTTGLRYVVRKLPKADAPRGAPVDVVSRHLAALCVLEHPHLCKVVECFDNHKEYLIVSEAAFGPPLLEFLKRDADDGDNSTPGKLHHVKEREGSELVRQIISALAHAHSRGIVHGRLEPTTLLLAAANGGGRGAGDRRGPAQIKIRDVGLSFVLRKAMARDIVTVNWSFAGRDVDTITVEEVEAAEAAALKVTCCPPETIETTAWAEDALKLRTFLRTAGDMDAAADVIDAPVGIAPENICKVDIWAVGVIAFRLLSGRNPFAHRHHKHHHHHHHTTHAHDMRSKEELLTALCTEPPAFHGGHHWHGDHAVSDDARDCVEVMLRMNPGLRPSAMELLKHPWLRVDRDQVAPHSLCNLFKNACVNLQEGQFRKAMARLIIQLLPSSHEHMEEASSAFRQLDRDRDGLLSFEEFKAGFDRFPELKRRMFEDKYWDEAMIFESADRDGSGALNLVEFCAATIPLDVARDEKMLWQVFRVFDRDEVGETSVQDVVDGVRLLDGSLLAPEQIKELCDNMTSELTLLGFTPDNEARDEYRKNAGLEEDEDAEASAGIAGRLSQVGAGLSQVAWRLFPRYRQLDYGEFVYLCGSSMRDRRFPYFLVRYARKEVARLLDTHANVDIYTARRGSSGRNTHWPPKEGASAQTPRSVHLRTGGVYAKKRKTHRT